jgi:SH3-like domain-containing protein
LEKLVVIVIYANILSSVQKRNKGILLPIYRDLEKNLNNDYIFSYTAATLMLHETDEVMKRYLEYKDWDKVKDLVIEENIMQKQSVSSRKRVFAEIKRRMRKESSKIDDRIRKIKIPSVSCSIRKCSCCYECYANQSMES